MLVLHSELGVLRGGGENFTRNLFAAFAERGHPVTATFVADPWSRYPIPLPPSIQPMPLNGWWSRNLGQTALSIVGRCFPKDGQLRKKWDYFRDAISWRAIRWHNRRFQRRVERVFNKRWSDFDAVYVHGDPLLASNVARFRPTVLRLPGPVSAEYEPELRSIHAVCANGDALFGIRRFLGNHATELPVGLDEKLFKPGSTAIRSKLQWTCQNVVVGYVGRLTHLKGVDLLAAAFREIAKTLPNARLLIIGSGEEDRNIRSVLAKEIDNKTVHIQVDVNHELLPEWYRAMDVLVMPSRYENFANALIEGMACGIPFIGSNVGGNRIVAETGAGWLFESESAASLTALLKEILQSSAKLKVRGQIGLGYVQEHHSWAATAERLEKIVVSHLGASR